MQVAGCRQCGGLGTIEFTKEHGGPVCPQCAGIGYLTRINLQRRIGAILDRNSVYMSGPSRQSMELADKILRMLQNENVISVPEDAPDGDGNV